MTVDSFGGVANLLFLARFPDGFSSGSKIDLLSGGIECSNDRGPLIVARFEEAVTLWVTWASGDKHIFKVSSSGVA